jgi:hypothetical protein
MDISMSNIIFPWKFFSCFFIFIKRPQLHQAHNQHWLNKVSWDDSIFPHGFNFNIFSNWGVFMMFVKHFVRSPNLRWFDFPLMYPFKCNFKKNMDRYFFFYVWSWLIYIIVFSRIPQGICQGGCVVLCNN